MSTQRIAHHPQPWCQSCGNGDCRGEHFMYVIVPADQSDPTFADDCAEYPIITVGATWGENIGRYSLPLVYVQATSNGDTYMTLDRAEELCGALQDAICNVRAVLNADHHAVCDCDD